MRRPPSFTLARNTLGLAGLVVMIYNVTSDLLAVNPDGPSSITLSWSEVSRETVRAKRCSAGLRRSWNDGGGKRTLKRLGS